MLVAVLAVLGGALLPGTAWAQRDYRDMVERIDVFLRDATDLYRNGDTDGAKTKVQKAYFEVFENLEGPIRVNISAKKNFALESEFAGIRKMIIAGEPVAEVAARIDAHVAELYKVLPELEGGFELKAEPAAADEATDARGTTAPADGSNIVEPHWTNVVEGIGTLLDRAATAYEAGDNETARSLIVQAQFDGYKNSLLETAVRRHVSQQQDVEYNAEFVRIVGLVRDGKPARMVRASSVVLIDDMKRVLPGLPLFGAAKAAQLAASSEPEKDWRAVADQVLVEMHEAVALYESGDPNGAVSLIQDTYFDVFEGSGMESKIGARDAAFMAQLESHFSKVIGRIKSDAPAAEIQSALATMKTDFAEAAAMLGEGAEPPLVLFMYSLLIILREGFEAILIVTAILAYLVKTGNQDKQKVIYNSVIVALLASVVTAVSLNWVFEASAAGQEVLEGATMLLAAVVLFSMSYWLISKAEAAKWMAYIKEKVSRSITSGSMAALWFASFLAVYREGAETVLFYQALTTDADAAGNTVILAGFVVGCIVLAFLYLAMRFGAMKLPIRPFFMVSGALLYFMAFVFAGKGMMELIEGKLLEPDLVSWLPEISFLGVFPYWQTVVPQMLLIGAALIAFALLLRQRTRGLAGSGADKGSEISA